MNIDDFARDLTSNGFRLSVPDTRGRHQSPSTVDALFHLPLLSLAVMVLAMQPRLSTRSVGNLVIQLLSEHFHALRRSGSAIDTSMTLRRRCADAVAFLERARLIVVAESDDRTIAISDLGRTRMRQIRHKPTDEGLLVRQLMSSRDRSASRGSVGEY